MKNYTSIIETFVEPIIAVYQTQVECFHDPLSVRKSNTVLNLKNNTWILALPYLSRIPTCANARNEELWQFAAKICKCRFYRNCLEFMEFVNRKTTFQALLGFVEAPLSSERSASETYLVPNHIHIPLCKESGIESLCLLVCLVMTDLTGIFSGL